MILNGWAKFFIRDYHVKVIMKWVFVNYVLRSKKLYFVIIIELICD